MQNVPITVKTVLLGSAKLLRDRGWNTCQEVAPDGRMCIRGAIRTFVAESGIGDPNTVETITQDAIRQVNATIWKDPTGAGFPDVSAWNDRQCKDAEHAIAMFERAASEAS